MKRYGTILTFSLMLFACEQKPAKAPESPPAPVKPVIKESKTGIASFYGKGFEGKKTYSGETYNSSELVAAHPTYPIGTIVRVTNLSTKDTIQVRISDRGPTSKNRREGVIIDLSRAAAAKINMVGAGRQKVLVEVLEWGDDPNNSDTAK